jgi:hypothetical protein
VPHQLRILASALCLAAGGLLIALWVRSYSTEDDVRLPLPMSWNLGIDSIRGRIILHPFDTVGEPHLQKLEWTAGHLQGGAESWRNHDSQIKAWHTIHMGGAHPEALVLPHWFLVVLAGSGTAMPWFIRRFNLRTLLTVVTAAAIAMGAIVLAN